MEAVNKVEEAKTRLHGLLKLQRDIELQFGNDNYNVFVFGSYLTTQYMEGKSDIDIAVYTEDFNLYKRLSLYLEEYFNAKGINSDIFFVNTTIEAPIYCAPLKSKVQFTDYYPDKLVDFHKRCEKKLEEVKRTCECDAGWGNDSFFRKVCRKDRTEKSIDVQMDCIDIVTAKLNDFTQVFKDLIS